MEIIRAETLGFCMGVRRAMQSVEEILHSDIPLPVSTYGPLIHNQRVLSRLRDRGIGRIDAVDEFSAGSVILRTHGVTPEETDALRRRGANIVDLTCPRVIKSQQAAAEAAKAGRQVILVGDRDHGELIAIAGFAPGCSFVRDAAEAETVPLEGTVLVVGQTTLREGEYRAVTGVLKRRNPRAEVADTLCPAAVKRQNALKDLAGRVDALLVIGGKNSANTGRLYRQAADTGKPAWHIEGCDDLPEEIFGFDRVGITAGASTPDWIIEEVETALRRRQ